MKDVLKYRVPGWDRGKRVDLKKYPTRAKLLYASAGEYDEKLARFQTDLKSFQEKLHAGARYSVLIVFQGMDTSGKDGAISHVMSGVNPQGCYAYSFRAPSSDELRHDFLWRTHIRMPGRGEIGIFNRSYYEELLVTRIHRDVLKNEGLPPEAMEVRHFWRKRAEDIRNHELHLDRQGTRIVKFFLHLSKAEQRRRLLDRLSEPKKNWKISESDFHERRYWKRYQSAYERCLEGTSTRECPWFIIPADDKKNARLLISEILMDELGAIPVSYPKMSPGQARQLRAFKKLL